MNSRGYPLPRHSSLSYQSRRRGCAKTEPRATTSCSILRHGNTFRHGETAAWEARIRVSPRDNRALQSQADCAAPACRLPTECVASTLPGDNAMQVMCAAAVVAALIMAGSSGRNLMAIGLQPSGLLTDHLQREWPAGPCLNLSPPKRAWRPAHPPERQGKAHATRSHGNRRGAARV